MACAAKEGGGGGRRRRREENDSGFFHRQKSGEDVQCWASPARFCSAAAGKKEGAYYLVAPPLHEGVMKTEQKEERGWASRRGKEESFCMPKYAKMASKTHHFDFRNGIYNSFCIILSPFLLHLTHFITHFFVLKIAHLCAPASVPKRRRELL